MLRLRPVSDSPTEAHHLARHDRQYSPNIMRPSANRSSWCRCPGVSLCTATGLAVFLMRMPSVVNDRSSPWYSYLQTVYRQTDIRLPVRLDKFEAFYPGLLPTAPCTLTSHLHPHHHSNTCAEGYCQSWLPSPAPSTAAVTSFLLNRSYIRVAAESCGSATLWSFGRLAAADWRAASNRADKMGSKVQQHASSTGDGVWMEVTRMIYAHEGTNDYGCWLHPVVGSGVFVRVSPHTLLSFPNRKHSYSAILAWSHHTPGGFNQDGDYPRLAATRVDGDRDLIVPSKAVGWQELGPTEPMHELILMGRQCMSGPELKTGCIPLATRTGLQPPASRPCQCDGEAVPEVINCAATAAV